MRQGLQQYRTGALPLASSCAFVLLLSVAFPVSADLCLVQKVHKSQKIGQHEPKVSDSIIRTWVTEGKLRRDYGDPATFIHITRLDRTSGRLVSYHISLGSGPYGNTYWTFCHPLTQVTPPSTPNDREARSADRKDTEPVSPADSRKAPTVTDTGETKIINNFHCRKYILKEPMTSTEFSSEIWVTTDILPALDRYGLVWGARIERYNSELDLMEASSGIADEMHVIKGFPVLITEIEQNRYVYHERRLELLEFEEGPLSPNQFELPKGLTKKYRGAMLHPPECED